MRHTLLCFAVVVTLARPTGANAQVAAISDSVAAHHLGAALMHELYYRIARAAFADSIQPVMITLPAGPAWVEMERHILVALRARPPRPEDRRMQEVRIDQVRF